MKIIPLSNEKVVLVDDNDYEILSKYTWYILKSGNNFYAVRWERIKKIVILMHRDILSITDSNVRVDHADHNGLNNQRYNIRIATISQNACNQIIRKNNTSGYKGVYKYKDKWTAQIVINKKKTNLGIFISKVEAAKAYNNAALEYHKEFASLNTLT